MKMTLTKHWFLASIMIVVLLNFTSNCWAYDATASSCSISDVRSAVDTVTSNGGGTVFIPEGDCTWNGEGYQGIAIDNVAVSFVGAGTDKTILRTTDGSNFFYYTTKGTHPYWEITGITFYSDLGCTSSCQTSTAIQIRNTGNFRVHHNHFEGYYGALIQPKSVPKGLIDHNVIINWNISESGSRYGITAGSAYGGGPPNPVSKTPPDGLPRCSSNDTYGCSCEVGEPSQNLNSSAPDGNTVISSVPAKIDKGAVSGTGTVRRIYVNIATAEPNATINVASFSRSGNSFTARARTTNLEVLPGLNIFAVDDNEFSPFAIRNGDYIGVYLNGATLEAKSGSSGWSVSGDKTNQGSTDFGSADIGQVALYAELFDDDGVFQTCEESWITWYNDESKNGGYHQAWKRDWQYDENAIYIEDNTISYYSNHINANWGGLAKMVVRHNTLYTKRGGVMAWAKPGNNFTIWHDNEYINIGPDAPNGYVSWINTDTLYYNNVFKNFGSGGSYEAYRRFSDYYFPYYTRPKELYIWNNTYENCNCGTTDEDCWYSANEGTFFMNQPGDNGSIHFRAPKAGERLYGFTEYTYPHPLTEGGPVTMPPPPNPGPGPDPDPDPGPDPDPDPDPTPDAVMAPKNLIVVTEVGTLCGEYVSGSAAAWYQPCGIDSQSGSGAEKLVDNDMDTVWNVWNTVAHSVVLDLGDTYTVSGLRKYHKQYSSDNGIAGIYVSNNTSEWGNKIGSMPAITSSAPSGWNKTTVTSKTGRYVKVVSEVVHSPSWREIQIQVAK